MKLESQTDFLLENVARQKESVHIFEKVNKEIYFSACSRFVLKLKSIDNLKAIKIYLLEVGV